MLFAYLCTSWSIVSGYSRQVSLGHSTFVGLGAYSTALLYYYFNLNPLIGLLASIASASAASLIIGVPSFKFGLRGPYYTFSTLAIAEFFTYLFIGLRDITGGELGLPLPFKNDPLYLQFRSKIPYYYIIMLMWLMIVLLARKIQSSKFGYYLFAIRNDETAAEACGINVFKTKIVSSLLSALLTSIGGFFYTIYYMYITPESVFGLALSFQIATTSLIGGATSWIGPSLGAFFAIPLLEITRTTLGGRFIGFPLLFYGLVLIIIGRYIPGGIASRLFKDKERVR
ncbi:branched-chain amino acid ABC transporter permease [Candidatus Bathyarchaeota archaeon]|nr:branched-chain amino acid ABC transporter permease [Candidatus Bathyarchaeota archaeon]